MRVWLLQLAWLAYGVVAVVASDQEAGARAAVLGPRITVLTGTHATTGAERLESASQSEPCQRVNDLVRRLWNHFGDEPGVYVKTKAALQKELGALAAGEQCVLAATKMGYQYTFPITMKSSTKCNSVLREILSKRRYSYGLGSLEARSRITVPWFLLRPNLNLLESMAKEAGVAMRVFASVGLNVESAAFMNEGCPRFVSILKERLIVQQRFLQVLLSDLTDQLRKLEHSTVVVHWCDDTRAKLMGDSSLLPGVERDAPKYRGLSRRHSDNTWLQCVQPKAPMALSVEGQLASTHLPSLLATDLFQRSVLPKTVFATSENKKPTLVFVAGVEGTGHHLWSVLGRKHTTRPLYDAFLGYLGEAPWNPESWNTFKSNRTRLVEQFQALHGQRVEEDGSSIFFLNTVFTETPVNMFSYPWGGSICQLKRFARNVCSIDLYDIAKMAEEADVDLRVAVIRRPLGAAVVSAARRQFGHFMSQTRMLGQAWSLLRTSLETIDPSFYDTFEYQDLIQNPEESAARIAKLVNAEQDSPLAVHFRDTLLESKATHGHKTGSEWKSKVTENQLAILKDFL